MSALADLLNTPMAANSALYEVQWRVKVIQASNAAALEAAINAWLVVQSNLTPTFFGGPVFLGTVGGQDRVLLPYGFFIPPA